jgi:hypothetical protein
MILAKTFEAPDERLSSCVKLSFTLSTKHTRDQAFAK